MSFIDLYFDDLVAGFPCYSTPRFSTSITQRDGGGETRNRNWEHPLFRFQLPEAIREQATFQAIYEHWLVVGGPESTFPFRDPLDFASIALETPNVEPDWSGLDQTIGVGDGETRTYQLTRTYTRGSASYERPIYLPVDGAVEILLNGVAPETDNEDVLPGGPYSYTISRPGGIVEFDHNLTGGVVVTWGGLFDVEVRFEADESLDGIVQSFQIAGYSAITLLEVRRC